MAKSNGTSYGKLYIIGGIFAAAFALLHFLLSWVYVVYWVLTHVRLS